MLLANSIGALMREGRLAEYPAKAGLRIEGEGIEARARAVARAETAARADAQRTAVSDRTESRQ